MVDSVWRIGGWNREANGGLLTSVGNGGRWEGPAVETNLRRPIKSVCQGCHSGSIRTLRRVDEFLHHIAEVLYQLARRIRSDGGCARRGHGRHHNHLRLALREGQDILGLCAVEYRLRLIRAIRKSKCLPYWCGCCIGGTHAASMRRALSAIIPAKRVF